MKTLEELINTLEPAWVLVEQWLADATNQYELLSKDANRAEIELLAAQVSTRSPMGSVIFETGGILIDYGWIRILGSGNTSLNRGLMEWNKTIAKIGQESGYLLIADDVIGGYFALNAGELGSQIGNVYYLPQDTLQWEDLGCGYSDFLIWTLSGDIQKFYEAFRWKSWREDLKAIDGNQTFSFYPFLWDDYENIEQLSRKAVPVEENYRFTIDMQQQLAM